MSVMLIDKLLHQAGLTYACGDLHDTNIVFKPPSQMSKIAAFVDDRRDEQWNLPWRQEENSKVHNAGFQ